MVWVFDLFLLFFGVFVFLVVVCGIWFADRRFGAFAGFGGLRTFAVGLGLLTVGFTVG